MTLENMIRMIAGTFVLASLMLGYLVSPYWHLFTAFVGLNLIQSAFTHWCLMEKILLRLNLARPHAPIAGDQILIAKTADSVRQFIPEKPVNVSAEDRAQ